MSVLDLMAEIPIEIYIHIGGEHRYVDGFNNTERRFGSVEELIEFARSQACYQHRWPIFHARVIIYECNNTGCFKVFDSGRGETDLEDVIEALEDFLREEMRSG